MNEKTERIPSLDGLRAISIVVVIISHMVFTHNFVAPPRGIWYTWFDSVGLLGVRVFFVISGFLITNLLLNELKENGRINLSRFYFRRTMRIFVPYYAFLLVMIVCQTVSLVHLTSRDFLHALTYTVNYYPNRSWPIGHAWSLSVEEQFYLLWPAILLLAGKRRGLAIAAAFFLVAPAIRLGYYYWRPELIRYEVGYRFETTADAIAIGCILAGTYNWLTRQSLYKRVMKSPLLALVPLIVLYLGLMDPQWKRYLVVSIPLQNIGIAACVGWGVSNYKGRVGKVLNSRPLVYLGVISYSVYLWQQPLLDPRSSAIFARFPLNLLLVAVAAVAGHYLIERPSLRMRRQLEERFLSHRRRRLEVSNE